jgi:NADH:ubiquinone oxidoreductase subunit K
MLETYLLFSSSILLFIIGLVTLLIRRNLIFMLIGLELMLNGANLNLVAAGRLQHLPLEAEMLGMFVLVVAVAEVAVGIALVVQLFKAFRTSDAGRFNHLEG